MAGLRPVVELMTVNFALLAFDQIVNSAAHVRYMFGGQVTVPLVIRMPQGAGHQLGPTHSHCLEAMFLHVPGLLVAVPATPADAKGLLKTAIRDENPVIFIEHESLYGDPRRGSRRRGRDGRLRPRADRPRGRRRDDRGRLADGAHGRTGRGDARAGARRGGRGDRPADVAPARPRHDPRLGEEDQPLRRRRGGLAARGRRREPRGADRRARLRRPRRADRARVRRRRADALFEAARGHRLPARAPDRAGGAREPRPAPGELPTHAARPCGQTTRQPRRRGRVARWPRS